MRPYAHFSATGQKDTQPVPRVPEVIVWITVDRIHERDRSDKRAAPSQHPDRLLDRSAWISGVFEYLREQDPRRPTRYGSVCKGITHDVWRDLVEMSTRKRRARGPQASS